MNWIFTRANTIVRFEKDEPFAMIFPVDLSLVESVEPRIETIDANPDLMQSYGSWTRARLLKKRTDWEPLPYTRGTYANGNPAPEPHRTKVNLRTFQAAEPILPDAALRR
jgi:hypothetical protein